MTEIYTTDFPCECGEYNLEISTGFVGYMGDKPCSESYGKCTKCGKELYNQQIDKRFDLTKIE